MDIGEWQLARKMRDFLHIFYIFLKYFVSPAYICL
nr:MAG TPA: hypothetical protein [Caudoviricetes sp.]